MKPIYISGETLQGESYKLFISCLFEKSNIFSYEVLKDFDTLHDMEDKKYLDNILKSEKISLLLEKNIVFRWAIMISLLICCFITEDCLVW